MGFLQQLLTLCIVCFSFEVWAYHCDTGELRRVLPREMTQTSSKKIQDEIKKSQNDAKRSVASIEKLKTEFNYNAASQYLFNDQALNTMPEHYTTTFNRGTKTFYLNQGRLIAILDQITKSEFLMTRLNKSCQPFEMISFTNMDPLQTANVRYKITPQFCRSMMTQNSVPPKANIEAMLSFVKDQKDRLTLRSLRRDCQFLKQSPAMPSKRKDQKVANR